jgi:hypothetical protein
MPTYVTTSVNVREANCFNVSCQRRGGGSKPSDMFIAVHIDVGNVVVNVESMSVNQLNYLIRQLRFYREEMERW